VDANALETTLSLAPVTPALFGVEGANTYLPAVSKRVFDLSDDERPWVLSRAGLFSTRYLSVAEGNASDVAASGKRTVETLPSIGYVLLEDTSALPRAYLAQPVCASGPLDSLLKVQGRLFTPGAEAVVECQGALPRGAGEVGHVLSLVSSPETVVVRLEASAPGVLVLNDAFYSGWRATVDGVATPLLAANHLVRAVFVQPGAHEVVFRYRTPGLLLGLVLTLLFLLGGGVASVSSRARRARTQPAAPFALALRGEETSPPTPLTGGSQQ
jgi:hypothetical protein